MLRTFTSYRPFIFFSVVAALFLILGFSLLTFLGVHYLRTGAFSPHIWSGFVGGSFALLGILTLVIGFIGDILVRMRMNQEDVLYLLKNESWQRSRRDRFDTLPPEDNPSGPAS